jgi:hypothetical protein
MDQLKIKSVWKLILILIANVFNIYYFRTKENLVAFLTMASQSIQSPFLYVLDIDFLE